MSAHEVEKALKTHAMHDLRCFGRSIMSWSELLYVLTTFKLNMALTTMPKDERAKTGNGTPNFTPGWPFSCISRTRRERHSQYLAGHSAALCKTGLGQPLCSIGRPRHSKYASAH
eukprot:1158531-Pelagomonas_calceolata.AAC.7